MPNFLRIVTCVFNAFKTTKRRAWKQHVCVNATARPLRFLASQSYCTMQNATRSSPVASGRGPFDTSGRRCDFAGLVLLSKVAEALSYVRAKGVTFTRTGFLVESGRGPSDTSAKRRDFCRTMPVPLRAPCVPGAQAKRPAFFPSRARGEFQRCAGSA